MSTCVFSKFSHRKICFVPWLTKICCLSKNTSDCEGGHVGGHVGGQKCIHLLTLWKMSFLEKNYK